MGRYYGLGFALIAARYLPTHHLHDSTSVPSDDAAGSGTGPVAPTPHPDESLLHRIEELETRDEAQQMEMI